MSDHGGQPETPDWVDASDRILRDASRRVSAISSATPLNLRADAERITVEWSHGREAFPAPVYPAPREVGEVTPLLSKLADEMAPRGELGATYARRCEELALDVRLAREVGLPSFAAAAAERFRVDAELLGRAEDLAREWVTTPVTVERGPLSSSSDPTDPRSLWSLVQKEIGRLRLGVRVVAVENLAPIAAVGDGVLQIAKDRMLSQRDAERTAMHEIEGHLVPQARAREQALGIFAFGTRSGSDDQEGRALWLERDRGFFEGARLVELGRRHLAASAVRGGAHFVETTRLLLSVGAETHDAVRIALRVHRGSCDGVGGLAREVVYLPALLAVDDLLASEPDLFEVLGCGRVGVAAASTLRPFVRR